MNRHPNALAQSWAVLGLAVQAVTEVVVAVAPYPPIVCQALQMLEKVALTMGHLVVWTWPQDVVPHLEATGAV